MKEIIKKVTNDFLELCLNLKKEGHDFNIRICAINNYIEIEFYKNGFNAFKTSYDSFCFIAYFNDLEKINFIKEKIKEITGEENERNN